MKKLIFAMLLAGAAFADTYNVYLYSVKVKYQEKDNGKVIDGEYNKFGDVTGLGVVYTNTSSSIPWYIKGELAGGRTEYKGATWGGTPIDFKHGGVGILELQTGVYLTPISAIYVGYRSWKRGKSDNPGDYDETYYWSYIGISNEAYQKFNKIGIGVKVYANYAINPKMQAYLGNSPILKLGKTYGYGGEFKINYYTPWNLIVNCFYRYDYWHITKSDLTPMTSGGSVYYIYEPDSDTKNQYIGIGILQRF